MQLHAIHVVLDNIWLRANKNLEKKTTQKYKCTTNAIFKPQVIKIILDGMIWG